MNKKHVLLNIIQQNENFIYLQMIFIYRFARNIILYGKTQTASKNLSGM